MILVTHLLLAGALLLTVNYLGARSRGYGYVSSTDIVGEAGNFGFNFLFRILTPSIYISFVSILFYYFDLPEFVQNIYLVVLYYSLINIVVIIVLNRWAFVNKISFFITQTFIFLTAYLFYTLALSKGLEFILPEAGNFRTELWLIILIYLYQLGDNFYPGYTFYEKRSMVLAGRFKKFWKEYAHLLSPEITQSAELSRIFFAIMIYEDLNRPPVYRFFEWLLFPLGRVSSSGIMQVQHGKYLSNEESVQLAQEKILKVVHENPALSLPDDADELIRAICVDYNGIIYFDHINSLYHELLYPHR